MGNGAYKTFRSLIKCIFIERLSEMFSMNIMILCKLQTHISNLIISQTVQRWWICTNRKTLRMFNVY